MASFVATMHDSYIYCKPGKGHHKCEHCHKLGHKIDKCYVFHGPPPQSDAAIQSAPSQPSTLGPTSTDTLGQPVIFNEFLRWY